MNLLGKGAGLAITPKAIPVDEYLMATESACKVLSKGEAAALRAEVTETIQQAKVPKSNLNRNEIKAMKELKNDEDIIILPADKGKCLVVMDRKDYNGKMEEKLRDATTYKRIEENPTSEIHTN